VLVNRDAPDSLSLSPLEGLASPDRALVPAIKLIAQWLLARPTVYSLPSALPFLRLGETIYRPPSVARRMAGGEAAVLCETARLQDAEAAQRCAVAERLRRAVETTGAGRVPMGWSGGRAGWLRLPLWPSDLTLRRAAKPVARRLGIMPGYPLPLSRLPGFRARVYDGLPSHPGADELAARLLTLPSHSQLTEADLVRLEQWLRAV
jgi:dTDP-4-amino-4,6-dideoxygalactose transaminase